jgi:hypothetical protein
MRLTKEDSMTDDQIKHMVSRFLGWRLPENFNPDAGISFKATFNEHTDHPMRHEPSGTNLLDFTQAEAMVRHMVEGMPAQGGVTRMSEEVEVTQADREMAAPIFDAYGASNYAALARRNSPLIDKLIIVRTLARHRLAERERCAKVAEDRIPAVQCMSAEPVVAACEAIATTIRTHA